MQLHHRRAEETAFLENELRMQREAYERAGADAYVLGVPRNGNPYLRRPDAYSDPDTRNACNALPNTGGTDGTAPLPSPSRPGAAARGR